MTINSPTVGCPSWEVSREHGIADVCIVQNVWPGLTFPGATCGRLPMHVSRTRQKLTTPIPLIVTVVVIARASEASQVILRFARPPSLQV